MNKILYNLKISNNFDDLEYLDKPAEETFELFNTPNMGIYKLIFNKYESITYENINYSFTNMNGRFDSSLSPENKNIKIINNIYTVVDVPIYPATIFTHLTKTKSDLYHGNFKYLSLMFNDYYCNLQNKKICIIKQIGPWEIDNDTLKLYFQEEFFFDELGHKTKSLFIYTDYENKKYNSIYNPTNFNYLVAHEMNDPKISKYISDCDIIIIDRFQIVRVRSCIHASIMFVQYAFLINNILKKIKPNADLVIQDNTLRSVPQYQLYNLLYLSFEKTEWIKHKLSYLKSGIFIFSNYKSINLNILNKFTNDYIKLDKYLGKHIHINAQNKTWCSQQAKTPQPETNFIITSIYDHPLDPNFIKIIKRMKQYNNTRLNKYTKGTELIRQNADDIAFIRYTLLINIDKSIKLLKKYKIKINPIYNDDIIHNNIINKLFNDISSERIIKEFKLSRDSIYNLTNYNDIKNISIVIKKLYKSENIVDCIAGIGSNSINFTIFFDHVYANENDETTYDVLSHNIKLMNKKIILSNYNLLDLIKYYKKKYIYFIDPPFVGISNSTLYLLKTIFNNKFDSINNTLSIIIKLNIDFDDSLITNKFKNNFIIYFTKYKLICINPDN